VTLLCGNVVSEEDEPSYNKAFYDACAHGKLEKVKNFIAEDPEWVNRPTPDGETCLHLTAVTKSYEVAEYIVGLGADVNKRVTHSKGLRMMPLAWHAYGGNHKIVRLLLDNGADVNLDFDLDAKRKATVTDVLEILVVKQKDPDAPPDEFETTHELLLSRGGKKYSEL